MINNHYFIDEDTGEAESYKDYIKELQGEHANLELKKKRGYREYWEGHIDGVWFIFTPSLLGEVHKIEYVVPEDPTVREKINNKKWAKASYWRIINSVKYGRKWEKHRPTSFLNEKGRHKIKWDDKNHILTIKNDYGKPKDEQ
tara:strand:+ start:274 stop:702 length:429 start_codon:yes stop_codon:yes gene_type:complete